MKKLLTLLVGALCSIGAMQAEEVTLGRTIELSSTPTDYTILSNSNAVVTLSDGTGDVITGKGVNYKSDKSVSINANCYRSGRSGTAITAYDENCYAGFKLEIAEGYKLTVSQLYAKVAASANFSYRIEVYDGTNVVCKSADKTIKDYKKSSASNTEVTVTPTEVDLTGTVFVRLHYWYTSSSTTKYLVPLSLTVTGDLVADKQVASTSTALTAVKVNGTAISDEDLATLVSSKSLSFTDKYMDAPSVVFTKTTTKTYDDNTTSSTSEDETVEATKGSDAFTASTTIGDDTYTISFGIDKTASLTADITTFTLFADKANIATQAVQVTGYNLSGTTTVTIPEVDGLTVSPGTLELTDGVAQTITISYKSNEDVASTSAELIIASGETTVTIPFTYSSTAAVTELVPVVAATTWDFTKAGSADIPSPNSDDMVCMANASGFADDFNYAALAAQGKYFYRQSNKCWQGRSIKFNAGIAGKVTVSFSNTGSSQNRSVTINGEKVNETGATSAGNGAATAETNVAAGEVVITGYNVSDASGADVRIYSITFTPTVENVSVSSAGLASYCSANALDFSGQTDVEAYVAASYTGNVVNMQKVEQVPANTGIILKSVSGGAATVSVPIVESATAPAANLLVGITAETSVEASADGSYNYIFANGTSGVGFYKLTAAHTLAAGKAYLHTTEDLLAINNAKSISMSFGGETTGISNVSNKAQDNGAYYTLSGLRVDAPTKGLYIKNGKKVIVK